MTKPDAGPRSTTGQNIQGTDSTPYVRCEIADRFSLPFLSDWRDELLRAGMVIMSHTISVFLPHVVNRSDIPFRSFPEFLDVMRRAERNHGISRPGVSDTDVLSFLTRYVSTVFFSSDASGVLPVSLYCQVRVPLGPNELWPDPALGSYVISGNTGGFTEKELEMYFGETPVPGPLDYSRKRRPQLNVCTDLIRSGRPII
jgi:hypothetical protein